jgi:tyrosyl-tRNA synthetase
MDTQTKVSLIMGVGQETVTPLELLQLLETDPHPIAYDGFEPSGMAHLPVGVYRPLLLKQLLKTGVRFKLLLADSYAWINDKMGGDLQKIKLVGKYFTEVWKASGVEFADTPTPGKVCTVSHFDQFVSDPQYWYKVFQVARHHSEARTKRALTIAGRKEDDVRQTAQLFYPSMQAADIFHLADDPAKEPIIAQLGLDQRKANMLARDVAEKIGYKKPIAIQHRMLLGLDGIQSASAADESKPQPQDSEGETTWVQAEIAAKMSKSRPETCIFVHDSTKQIQEKISRAYCPAKIVEGNPIVEYAKELVFRANPEFTVNRSPKFGGPVTFTSYGELETEFKAGKLHPMDLKAAVATEIDLLVEPVRTHFEKDPAARRLLEQVNSFQVTR